MLPATDVMPLIAAVVTAMLVDTVYAIAGRSEKTRWDGFARERGAATTRLIADLLLTAWERSAAVKLPDWDKRKYSL